MIVLLKRCLLSIVILSNSISGGSTTRDYVDALGLHGVMFPEVNTECSLEVDWRREEVFMSSSSFNHSIFSTNQTIEGLVMCATNASSRTAVLTMSTDLAYLQKWKAWTMNKLCFCSRGGLSLLLFVGSISMPTERCSEGHSNHWIKAIALGTALEKLSLHYVLVVDTDIVFTPGATPSLLRCYETLSRNEDIIAGLDHYTVFLNAALLLVRRSSYSLALAKLWWRDRCGEKDQLVLWSSLFSLWNIDDPSIDYKNQLLNYTSRENQSHNNYSYMRARRVVVFELAEKAFPTNFQSKRSPSGRIMFRPNQIVRFPHLALFPYVEIDHNCVGLQYGRLPPFRHVSYKHRGARGNRPEDGFAAHTKKFPPSIMETTRNCTTKY